MTRDLLCEGVRALLAAAAAVLPVRGLGVVRKDGPEHAILTYGDRSRPYRSALAEGESEE